MNLTKLTRVFATGCIAFSFAISSAHAGQAVKLDLSASQVSWLGKKVTGQHTGKVKLKSGEVMVENGVLKGGSFIVDMTSITDEDLTDATYHAKLLNHLKSDDFFGVEKHPTAEFKITQVEPIAKAAKDKPNYTVTGDLTIKGITHSVTFPAWISVKDGKAQAKGTMSVDRTQYEIRYGSGKFFENLGDKMIYDQFNVDLNLVGSI